LIVDQGDGDQCWGDAWVGGEGDVGETERRIAWGEECAADGGEVIGPVLGGGDRVLPRSLSKRSRFGRPQEFDEGFTRLATGELVRDRLECCRRKVGRADVRRLTCCDC
jgi:hypothetical protein